MSTATDWQPLLAALRAEGVAVGPGELIRLQQVFRHCPPLDRQGLKQILACLLVKTPAQRETFARLFEQWCPEEAPAPPPATADGPASGAIALHGERRATPASQPLSADASSTPGPVARELPPARQLSKETRRFALFAGLLCALFAAWLGYTWWLAGQALDPAARPAAPPAAIAPAATAPPAAGELPAEAVATYRDWRPHIVAVRPPWRESAWLPGLLGLAAAVFLWRRYDRRSRLPTPVPCTRREDVDWLPWLTLEERGAQLLDPDELRTLVWGIGHFVSDEPTQAVDVERSVAATARSGGLAELVYRRAVHQREVWLWQDSLTRDPLLEALAEEIADALRRAGLPVRRGWFAGLPERIVWQEGQVFSTLVLEGHRQSAVVAILTDGHGLRLAARSDLDRRPLAQLLAALGQWPHLAFVDLGRGENGLAEALRPYRVDCLAPEALPAFLGLRRLGAPPHRAPPARLLGELRVWAAGLALSPEAPSDDDAYALRRALRLTLPPRALADLRRAAAAADGRIAFSAAQRAELLNWLTQAERPCGKVALASLLARALAFWRARLRRERQRRRRAESALQPWHGTLAEGRHDVERALLALWRKPRWAAAILYRLADGPLRQEIAARLAALAGDDWRGARSARPVVFLPWRETGLPTPTRYLLRRTGFADQLEPRAAAGVRLVRPAAVPLAAGLAAGLGALALALSLFAWWRPGEPSLRAASPVFDEPAFRRLTIGHSEPSGPGRQTLSVGTPRQLVQATVPAGSEVTVDWRWQESPNRERFGDSELWRAGTLPQAIRACEPGWPRRSLVVIAADPAERAARQLAVRLLDRGSADAVLLGKDWPRHYRTTLLPADPASTADDQLLLVVPATAPPPATPQGFRGRLAVLAADDLTALARALDFAGTRPLREVWNGRLATVLAGDAELPLRGGPPEQSDPASGVAFVAVCGGTFVMGSAVDDPLASKDEKPAHAVALPRFEIGQHEVTFEQYDRFAEATRRAKPNDFGRGRGRQPVVGVTWDDARAFCEHYGYALPSEAQWEYAARAGSAGRWSFGDDEGELGRHAWFAANSGDRTHPVGEKAANALGLHDMHGNAWEWVADCYDAKAYERRAGAGLTVEPLATGGACSLRVLRGGAYWVVPRDLRSADRLGGGPVIRDDFIGFRCVRGPRRQPP